MHKKEFNTIKYIKIPFKEKGRDFYGCDCYGLVKLVYEKEYNIIIPDFIDYDSSEDRESIKNLIDINKPLLNAIKKEYPEYGDICVFNIFGFPSHFGIYIGEGIILHIMRGCESVCDKLNSPRLKGRLEGFYELN